MEILDFEKINFNLKKKLFLYIFTLEKLNIKFLQLQYFS